MVLSNQRLVKLNFQRTTKCLHFMDCEIANHVIHKAWNKLNNFKRFNALHNHFFVPIHRSYFCVRRTDGAARIYFSSLYLSRNVSPYGRGLFPCMLERERGKKKEQRRREKPRKNHFTVTGFEPTDSVSRAERAIH